MTKQKNEELHAKNNPLTFHVQSMLIVVKYAENHH